MGDDTILRSYSMMCKSTMTSLNIYFEASLILRKRWKIKVPSKSFAGRATTPLHHLYVCACMCACIINVFARLWEIICASYNLVFLDNDLMHQISFMGNTFGIEHTSNLINSMYWFRNLVNKYNFMVFLLSSCLLHQLCQ